MTAAPHATALDPAICERARLARDPRFDGLFFIAVTSTGIFCRTVCPVPAPKASNVRYYDSAAAATAAGFRPCLRCRPEAAPGSPLHRAKSELVAGALGSRLNAHAGQQVRNESEDGPGTHGVTTYDSAPRGRTLRAAAANLAWV